MITLYEPASKMVHRDSHLWACMVKPWTASSARVLQDQQTFLINFNLINERRLAIRVVCVPECHVITTEPVVLEIRFDIRVLWITSLFPEQIKLASQGLTVFVFQQRYIRFLKKNEVKDDDNSNFSVNSSLGYSA